MEQVKRRLRVVRTIASGTARTGDDNADAEFACLQTRKALELIAFATLSANRERYAQVRADIAKEWRASKILERLRRMNPHFYPKPVIEVPTGAPGHHYFDNVTDGFLTEEEFAFLYDKCSDALHEWNPFRPEPRRIELQRHISDWADRIERLLTLHYVQLVDQDDVLLVQLNASSDGKAHVYLAQPT